MFYTTGLLDWRCRLRGHCSSVLYDSLRLSVSYLADTEIAPTNKFLSKTTIVTLPMAGTYIEAFSLTSGPKFWGHMAG